MVSFYSFLLHGNIFDETSRVKNISPHRELNPRPFVWQTNVLPVTPRNVHFLKGTVSRRLQLVKKP